MSKNDGGSAFPREVRQEISINPLDFSKVGSMDDVARATEDMIKNADRGHGMSLRDYFAAKALQPFMVWALDQPHFEDYDTAAKAAAGYAESAYIIADAMLAERVK